MRIGWRIGGLGSEKKEGARCDYLYCFSLKSRRVKPVVLVLIKWNESTIEPKC